MTLKEFATYQGLNYQTAKTWLRRGKIREVSAGEFQIGETSVKPAAKVSIATETLKPETLRGAVKPGFNETPIETISETLKPETRVETTPVPTEIAALWATIERQAETIGELTRRIADLEATRQATQRPHPGTVRRNGRAEIVDGDYLESQRWAE